MAAIDILSILSILDERGRHGKYQVQRIITMIISIRFHNRLLLSSFIVLACLFPACRNHIDSGLQQTVLRLKWTTQSQFAGAYWAQGKGLFKQNHLDVTILPGGPNINEMQIVASGAEDFGIGGPGELIPAREKGVPVVAIAVIFQRGPGVCFAKKESGIREPKGFIGRTVALSYGGDTEYIYRAMMKRSGIDTSLVKEYPAKFDLTPFFRGVVDIWVGYDTDQTNTAEENGFEITRIYPDDYGVKMAGDTLYTTENVIKNKPEMCQQMVDGLLDAWHAVFQNKEAAVEMVLTLDNKLNRKHEVKMLDAVERLTLTKEAGGKIGWMTGDQWKEMVGLWKEVGGIKGEVDYRKCYDSKFVENYYNRRVRN